MTDAATVQIEPAAEAIAVQDRSRALEVIRSAWRLALEPRRMLRVHEWADANRRFAGSTGESAGRWRNHKTPYLVGVMRAFDEPGVRAVSLKKCAQSGGTEAWINLVCATVSQRPRPLLIVYPNLEQAREISAERLVEELRATPEVREKLGQRSRDIKGMSIQCTGMRIRLTGAGSDANLSSWPQAIVIFDECDQYLDPAGVFQKGEARTATFRRPLIVKVSTPSDEARGIDAEYEKGDACRYYVPCPRCGDYQTLRFGVGDGTGGVRWEGGTDADPDTAQRTAFYQCATCEGRILEHEKRWMLMRGVWLQRGVEPVQRLPLDDADAVRRAALLLDTAKRWEPETHGDAVERPAHRSFHIHGAMSPFVEWGQLAREFVEKGGRPEPDWYRLRLGEAWRVSGMRADDGTIIRYATEEVPGEPHYRRGEAPAGVLALTGAIDVQKNGVYFEVRGWGEHGAAWLIDYGTVYCPMELPDTDAALLAAMPEELRSERDICATMRANPWALVERLLCRVYPSMATGEQLEAWAWCVDVRWRRDEVMRFAGRHSSRVTPVQGSDGAAMAGETNNHLDKVHGIHVLTFNSRHWKDKAWSHVHRRPPAAGAWRWPSNVERSYARQLLSEELVEVRDAKGRTQRIWRVRAGHEANHFWDVCYLNTAHAHYLGAGELTPLAAAAMQRGDGGQGRGVVGRLGYRMR